MNEQKIFETIQESCLSDGIKILIKDIERNRDASDTLMIRPFIEDGVVISSQTDQMLKQQGYVQGLNWVLGLIQHYQENDYQEPDDDI